MKYINRDHLLQIGIDWEKIVNTINQATCLIAQKDIVQPIKPYLRYNDLANRIIAMPAYVGGQVATAGIKWIASFPKNIQNGIPRAHSVIILNDGATGIPIATINTPLISGIRTAAVTGSMLNEYVKRLPQNGAKFNVGIIGFGPIGQLHLQMIYAMFSHLINKIFIYDLRAVNIDEIDIKYRHLVHVADSWAEAYQQSKIFITCTVSAAPYIDIPPAKGTFQLNVSLRDYKAELIKHIDLMIVDDWDEICRENTDVEQMHLQFGLQKSDVVEIHNAFNDELWQGLDQKTIMFNPMGMAVYDIAVAKYYYDQSMEKGIGLELE